MPKIEAKVTRLRDDEKRDKNWYNVEIKTYKETISGKFEHWELEVCAIIEVVRRKHPELAPTWDVMRRHIESLPASVYAATAYYEKWALGFFLALFESTLPVSRADLASAVGVAPGPRAVGAARSQSSEVVFNVGDTVQVEREDAAIFWLRPHLRTPGYIFGKRGVVERGRGPRHTCRQPAHGIAP